MYSLFQFSAVPLVWSNVVRGSAIICGVVCCIVGVAHAVCVQVHTMTGRVVWRARM